MGVVQRRLLDGVQPLGGRQPAPRPHQVPQGLQGRRRRDPRHGHEERPVPIPCSIPLPSQTIHWGLRELLAGAGTRPRVRTRARSARPPACTKPRTPSSGRSGVSTTSRTTAAGQTEHHRNLGKLWEDWAWDRRIWAEILWAWGSTCVAPNGSAYSDMADYHRMWEGIQASGRSMILTVEGR